MKIVVAYSIALHVYLTNVQNYSTVPVNWDSRVVSVILCTEYNLYFIKISEYCNNCDNVLTMIRASANGNEAS